MRFGEYLMERGLLTSDQVESVLEAQGRTNVWFGTLAYLLDYLDFDDIAEILAVQQRDGGRFGEIAARLGLLDFLDDTRGGTRHVHGRLVGFQ